MDIHGSKANGDRVNMEQIEKHTEMERQQGEGRRGVRKRVREIEGYREGGSKREGEREKLTRGKQNLIGIVDEVRKKSDKLMKFSEHPLKRTFYSALYSN